MLQLPTFSHAPIDLHSHFNHGSPFDVAAPIPQVHNRDIGFLKAEYDRFGIRVAGMSTFASVFEHVECVQEENRYLYALTARELPPAPRTHASALGLFFQWSAGMKESSARPTEMGSFAWPQSLSPSLEMEEISPNCSA